MIRKNRDMAIGSGAVGLLLIGAAVFNSLGGSAETVTRELGGFVVDTVGADAGPQLSEKEAIARARQIVDERLPSTDVNAQATTAQGGPVRVASLPVVEAVFAPAAAAISSEEYGFSYTTPNAEDVWVVVFDEVGLTMDDFKLTNGGLFVAVVFEDATGKVTSLTIERYDPSLPGPHYKAEFS